MLWISIAGMKNGKPEHFKHKHLAPLMPGFDMLVMEIPLRNTSEVIKLAGLDSNVMTSYVSNIRTSPVYSLPPNLMSGIQCRQIKVKLGDRADLERGVEEACKEMLERTGGKGFPVLFDATGLASSLVATVQRVVGAALLYTYERKIYEATEAEVEEWLMRWKRGEERRALVADVYVSRGWEAKEVLAIGLKVPENLVMRTCGFCVLVKAEKPKKVNKR